MNLENMMWWYVYQWLLWYLDKEHNSSTAAFFLEGFNAGRAEYHKFVKKPWRIEDRPERREP